jgi:hypothetical protein
MRADPSRLIVLLAGASPRTLELILVTEERIQDLSTTLFSQTSAITPESRLKSPQDGSKPAANTSLSQFVGVAVE